MRLLHLTKDQNRSEMERHALAKAIRLHLL